MTTITCKQPRTDAMATDPDYFYYRGDQLVNLIEGQGQNQPGQRFFQTATGLSAQINVGGNAGTWLIGTDVLGSVLAGSDGTNPEEHRYAPYGGEKQQGATESVMKLGYTGAYRDPLTGLYPLGNGARCYLPELMCFNKPDSLSPFGAGGINTRSYCEGDPINHSDPSGHAKQGGWLAPTSGLSFSLIGLATGFAALLTGGLSLAAMVAAGTALALGATGLATGVASVALSNQNEQTKEILGDVSFGLGLVSAIAGGGALLMQRFGIGAARAATRTVDDRAARATARFTVGQADQATEAVVDLGEHARAPVDSGRSNTVALHPGRLHPGEEGANELELRAQVGVELSDSEFETLCQNHSNVARQTDPERYQERQIRAGQPELHRGAQNPPPAYAELDPNPLGPPPPYEETSSAGSPRGRRGPVRGAAGSQGLPPPAYSEHDPLPPDSRTDL